MSLERDLMESGRESLMKVQNFGVSLHTAWEPGLAPSGLGLHGGPWGPAPSFLNNDIVEKSFLIFTQYLLPCRFCL